MHDEVDVIDVDAARSDIGRDEHPRLAGRKSVERSLASVLLQVSVDRRSMHAAAGQLHRQPVGAVLGPHEDQRASGARGELGDDRDLVLGAKREHPVLHRVDVRRRRRDRVQRRVLEVGAHELVDASVERCREQHPLPVGRGLVEDGRDRGQEAEVSHVVGFVDHRNLDTRQHQAAPLEQVDQSAGRRDDKVDAPVQRVDLLAIGRTAEDATQLQAERLTEGTQCVGDLHREFASRNEHEGARRLRHAHRPRGREASQHRQAEGHGLAAAGLCAAENVSTGQGVGDRVRLDRERLFDAALAQRHHEGLRQAEFGKGAVGGRLCHREVEQPLELGDGRGLRGARLGRLAGATVGTAGRRASARQARQMQLRARLHRYDWARTPGRTHPRSGWAWTSSKGQT